jgi:hypothetical protein
MTASRWIMLVPVPSILVTLFPCANDLAHSYNSRPFNDQELCALLQSPIVNVRMIQATQVNHCSFARMDNVRTSNADNSKHFRVTCNDQVRTIATTTRSDRVRSAAHVSSQPGCDCLKVDHQRGANRAIISKASPVTQAQLDGC